MTSFYIRAVSITALLLGVVGCASDNRPDPRDTVKELFTAMRNSDSTYLSQHIDFGRAVGTLDEEFMIDSVTPEGDPSQGLLSAMTGEGKLRARWLENQIVLGRATVSGDTAWVEVSFIDRLTRVQYYNKMRLDFRRDHWVINSFRTL
jgi:hypothetical protein